jgi:hypothetical protein
MHLQRSGMTTALIVTDAFLPLALAQMEVYDTKVPLIVIPHPLGGLKPPEVADRVGDAVEQLRNGGSHTGPLV